MKRQSNSDVTVTYADGRRVIKAASAFRKTDQEKQETRELLEARRREEREQDDVMD